MQILFTGASSLTGMWFVQELARRGHSIVATFTRSLEEYTGMRLLRIKQLIGRCQMVFECPFGSPNFMSLIRENGHFDLFCHHAAEVSNYKSSDFDFSAALKNNTHNVKAVLQEIKAGGCRHVLLTGSVFEQREGVNTFQSMQNLTCEEAPLVAVSPYGLSKGMTSDVFRYFTASESLSLGKFVIPNPFGPYEEGRFTSYLAKKWMQEENGVVDFPDYVRDNIPVSLLAECYGRFAEKLVREKSLQGFMKIGPSFRPESQGLFVARFSREMQKRLNRPCEFTLSTQKIFTEPLVRINPDVIDLKGLEWEESVSWDELAKFYAQCRF